LLSVEEHCATALSLVTSLAPVTVPLAEALDLTLAADVRALIDAPSFDNSAMDGYAVLRADLVGASAATPVSLPVTGEVAAGGAGDVPLTPRTAMRIMTGAPIPPGADAVVPVEATDGGVTVVAIMAQPREHAHIRWQAEDVAAGAPVVREGQVLGPAQLAAIAAVGWDRVSVRPRPRVAVLTTGDELVSPGETVTRGRIVDSNQVLLHAAVSRAGGVPVAIARVRDDAEAVVTALEAAQADLIVTTGGVSVGAYDVVKAALASRGVTFVNVAMQPGKPQGLGRLGVTPVVCLPGNPVSVMVSFEVIVAPMIRKLLGAEAAPVRESATVARGWTAPEGRTQFMPVSWVGPGEVEPASPGGSGSHLVASLARAEALAVVQAQVGRVGAGDTVEIMRLEP